MEVGTEIRLKTPSYPLTTAEIGETCLQASDAIAQYFGPEYRLPSNWVKRITIRDFSRLHLKTPDTLGSYYHSGRSITLFPERQLGKDRPIRTLSHEIGHAFHHFLIEKGNRKDDRTLNHESVEAFANWLETIIRFKGEVALVNDHYKYSVKPESRIFTPGQIVSNEALLHFIERRWGLKTVLDVVEQMPRPVTKQERIIDTTLTAVTLPGVILGVLARLLPYDEYLGRFLTSNRRAYHRFENFVQQNLGLSIDELSREAIQWYKKLDQKPVTVAPNKPNHYPFPQPPKFFEGPKRSKINSPSKV